MFRIKYCYRSDEVAVCFPLVPVLANLSMVTMRASGFTFCLYHSETDAGLFFNFLKTGHPSIKFTIKSEIEHKIYSLDVRIDSGSSSPITSVFCKSTYTGLLKHFSKSPSCEKCSSDYLNILDTRVSLKIKDVLNIKS